MMLMGRLPGWRKLGDREFVAAVAGVPLRLESEDTCKVSSMRVRSFLRTRSALCWACAARASAGLEAKPLQSSAWLDRGGSNSQGLGSCRA